MSYEKCFLDLKKCVHETDKKLKLLIGVFYSAVRKSGFFNINIWDK